MVSKYTKLGGALLIFSILLLFLINTLQIPIPFATGNYGKSNESVAIPSDGTYVDIFLGEIDNPIHPFTTYLSVTYTLNCENGQSTANTMLLYSSTDSGLGQIPWTDNNYWLNSEIMEGEVTNTMTFSIQNKYAARKYSIYLRIACDINHINTGNLFLQYTEMSANFMLFSTILPILCANAGIVVMIAGFIINYRRMAKGKGPTVKPEWEPSLQWGSSASSAKKVEKTHRMAIKPKTSSTKSKTKRTIVKKVVSKNASTIACKFCGKMTSPSAFFCQHCYGKIR